VFGLSDKLKNESLAVEGSGEVRPLPSTPFPPPSTLKSDSTMVGFSFFRPLGSPRRQTRLHPNPSQFGRLHRATGLTSFPLLPLTFPPLPHPPVRFE
jgi:hypothetical protein